MHSRVYLVLTVVFIFLFSSCWQLILPDPTCSIIYHSNGADSGDIPPAAANLEHYSLWNTANNVNLERTGFLLIGWNTKSDGSGILVPIGGSINLAEEDVHLYARWEALDNAFISLWDTSLGEDPENSTIRVPINYSYEETAFYVFWGDETRDYIKSTSQQELTHSYETPGIYEISMIGICSSFGFGGNNNDQRDSEKLLEINQWGTIKLHDQGYQFINCINLVDGGASDAPDLSENTNLRYIFLGAESMNMNLSAWDMSNIEDVTGMFYNCSSFNEDLSSWDLSSTSSLCNLFHGASQFNQDISSWKTSHITDMSGMFYDGASFNQDLSSWETSSVENMRLMFTLSGLESSPPSWYSVQ